MKRVIFVLISALTVAGAAYAAAKPKPPIFAQPLGAARVGNSLSVNIAKGSNLVFARVTIRPGGNFGWHVHHAPVAVAVVSGTLTLHDSSDPSCRAQPMKAGQGFLEPVNHIHLARNEGTKPVQVLVTYLGVPQGKSLDAPAAQPTQCGAVK
jgi:quercetin dioxygenase-like cupin family protein